MASRLETLSEDEIIAINEAALPSSTKKARKFCLLVWTSDRNFFLTQFITKSKQWTSQKIPKIIVTAVG